MEDKESIIRRIDTLLSLDIPSRADSATPVRQLYVGTLNLTTSLYGPDSPQVESLKEINQRIMNYHWSIELKYQTLGFELKGFLKMLREEIEVGIVKSIRAQAKAEILADFIT